MKKMLLALLSVLMFSAVAHAKDITGKQALEILKDPSVVLIDVRTPQEFKSGHIEGAIMIDFYSKDFKEQIAKLDKSKTYVLFCRSDNRSGQAEKIMNAMGFNNTYDVKGGVIKWMQDGLPLVK